MPDPVYLGIDVGTGSVRAGLFDQSGRILVSASRPIELYQDSGGIAEQSSEDVWGAVCQATKEALNLGRITPADVCGIGFDATCSLVVVDHDGAPLSISATGDPNRNIIVWMDHRATDQAAWINTAKHDVLQYVGGQISPEMQTPKLLWLKQNQPSQFDKAGHFFDLADFLTWRATDSLVRSSCTVTCKWTYIAHESRWDRSYFASIGLGCLADEEFARIGAEIRQPGTAIASGLTAKAARELGLAEGIPVAAGVIDAHAGGIATVGASGGPGDATTRMAYVFGTSACTMTSTATKTYVQGVWGPYFDAMVPNLWLNEGGQSSAGDAINRLLAMHPSAADQGLDPDTLADSVTSEIQVEADKITVIPDFNGNRSPDADPDARAIIAGLGTDTSAAALYAAGVAGIGYGLRQILSAQALAGITTDAFVISGGAGKHPFVRQTLANTTGLPILVTETDEPVLLGSAMLGAVAGGAYPDLATAMTAMSRLTDAIQPEPARVLRHDTGFARFCALQDAAR
ncbi:MAG: FGGY-family carbohydrate kinase [Pseudomonadota bacterium]